MEKVQEEPKQEVVDVKDDNNKGEKRDGNRDRRDNNGKNKNYQKRDNTAEGKDKYREKRQNDRKALFEKWENEITVTLETEVPELPKEKLEQPKNDELRQKLKDLDKDINVRRDNIVKLKADRSEAIDEDRKNREEKQGSLKGLFNQIKEFNEEIKDLMHEKKLCEDDLDKISREKDLIIKGMAGKKMWSYQICADRIDELHKEQSTARLTATEERAILKEKKELEQSLPMISQCESKDKESKEIKEKKKVLGKKIHDKIEAKNKLSAQIDEVKKKQQEGKEGAGEENKDKKKEDRPKHPLTIKIEKCKEDIERFRNTKTTIKEEHEKAYQAWRDQNELETKINWINNKKAYLARRKKDEEYHAQIKAEEDKIKADKEEYEKLYGKPKKYQAQIDVCDNLISFLESLRPRTDGDNQDDEKTDYTDVDNKLKSGEWKKEKMHVLKKEEEDCGVQPGQGKKKGKGKKRNVQANQEEAKLALSMETLSYFDSLKVTPPNFKKELDDVLKVLEEKKAYFIKTSDDINDGKAVETEEKKPEEETKDEPAEKPEPKQKRAKVNLDDEEMFPSMG